MRNSPLFLLSICLLAIFTSCSSLTLSTNKRWIVDDATGKRVKLSCAHWVAHSKPMLAEGLNKLPLNDIVTNITKAGFNCVRFSYATYMFTRYSNDIVSKTISAFDIPEIVSGIEKHNPSFLNMTHLQAYEAVVDALGAQGVMVLINNHVSYPKWCCNDGDQNGFFGDRHFNPDEWLQGLAIVANHFKGKSNVVAMDLRNELRGSRQNVKDWYKYMTQGAKTIHQHNQDFLVVVSGLNYDIDLSFLKRKSLDLNFHNKLVYESHLYSWSSGLNWNSQPVNTVCASAIQTLIDKSGFLIGGENPAPLWLSEFGYDMSGGNSGDNKYLACLASFFASVDLDWSLWAFGGSYYLRQGNVDTGESYGVMDFHWKKYRDPKFKEKFQLLQKLVQDPSSNLAKSHIMFHPLSGNCVHRRNSSSNELELGDCNSNNRWSFEGHGSPIRLVDTAMCLKAIGEGLPPTLSEDCLSPQSSWRAISASGLHLANFDKSGIFLCLERDSNSSKIVTKKCICVDQDDPVCLANPQNQWFQLVSTNV